MTDWLLDTLAWTAVLIALVLVLRRPVARKFGPQSAYALWLLPFLRLVLPPIQLPSWMAPLALVSDEAMTDPVPVAAEMAMGPAPDAVAGSGPSVLPVATGVLGSAGASPQIDWATIALAVWLIGASAFLWLRFRSYFRMRSEMLAEAAPVGEAGKVRLVETPVATSPVAFGVIDRVVALPVGFMASYDRTARDLALDHELAHHTGRDLLANFAVQPLFALHWFNPLGWLGWTAMRRDQEAACDARVIANRSESDRMAYANVIAGFAAGPNVALAAPMACPVLGDKSIVHRLKSLRRPDISPRRRFAGRAMVGLGVLALPLTASISYAESLTFPEPPAAPIAPASEAAPAVPKAPAADAIPAPDAPPVPPMPPLPPSVLETARHSANTDRYSRELGILAGGAEKMAALERRLGQEQEKLAVDRRRMTELRKRISAMREHLAAHPDKMAEFDERMQEARLRYAVAIERMAQLQGRLTKSREKLVERIEQRAGDTRRLARIVDRHSHRDSDRPQSSNKSEPSSVTTVRYRSDTDGQVDLDIRCEDGDRIRAAPGDTSVVLSCHSSVRAETLAALEKARASLASTSGLTAEVRAEVLKEIDREIRSQARRE